MALADYLALVAPEHADKPKFMSVLATVLQPLVDAQAACGIVAAAFDLDTAAGVQLDAVGAWIGRSRVIDTPLAGVYFSFDIAGLGFDQGVWFGPYDPVEGLTVLDDAHYRLLLRAKIAANNWDGTLPGAEAALAILQITPSLVFLEDRQDMSMVLGVAGQLPDAVTISLLCNGYVPVKPSGVAQNVMITTISGAPVFGFDAENEYVSGFDVGAWGASNTTLLF